MVIVDVFANQPTKMSLMECNDMIENLAPATSHPSFRGSILPWRMNARPFGLQSRCLEESDHRAIECRVAIEDHVPIRTSFGESFAQLLDNPIRCGVAGHVEVQNPAPAQTRHSGRERRHLKSGRPGRAQRGRFRPVVCDQPQEPVFSGLAAILPTLTPSAGVIFLSSIAGHSALVSSLFWRQSARWITGASGCRWRDHRRSPV